MNVMNLYVYENRSMSNDLLKPIMLENLNVDNVQIHIPKEIDGTDMGTWAWWFVYQNAKREKYSIPMTLEGTTNDDGEEEYISTVGLNHGFTGKHGTVMYAIEAIQADGSGAVTHEWHTKTCKLEIVYTLQGNQTEYDESESDIISALISRVNELIQSGAEIAEIAETIEHAAETAQEVIDSIPADYSELSNRVGANTIALAEKADRATTYTKTQVDQMIEAVEVETDTTLEIAGAPADAAETGRQLGLINESLDDVKADLDALDEKIDNVSDTLSPEIKEALLNCFNHVAWSGDNGRSYYNALESALSGDNPPQPIYNWDFTQSLMDSKSGKIAELTASTGVSNPTRDSQGVHFTAAGQALLLFDENKNLADFANKTIQVDVASFVPDSANNNFHVRFLMYNRPPFGWDSGMVFRQAPSPNLGWNIYGNGGWGSASAWGSLTNRTDISGHTVSLYLDENLVPKLYIDSVLKGTQTLGFNTTGVGLMIGNINTNPAAQGGTFYQSVVTGCRIYNGEVA